MSNIATNPAEYLLDVLLDVITEHWRYDEIAGMTDEDIVAVFQAENVNLTTAILMQQAPHVRAMCHDYCFTDPDELY